MKTEKDLIEILEKMNLINAVKNHPINATVGGKKWIELEEHSSLFKGYDIPKEYRDNFYKKLYELEKKACEEYSNFISIECAVLKEELESQGIELV